MTKSTAKKFAAKPAVKNGNAKPIKPLHAKLIALMTRPKGATLADIKAAKFNAAAMQALKIVERRGFKTSVVKKDGELTRYVAKRA
jgi:hypothetical protein